MIWEENGKLYWYTENERVCLEAWGKDAIRVRTTRNRSFTGRTWALDIRDEKSGRIQIEENGAGAIHNGCISGRISKDGVISFSNSDGRLLLSEEWKRLRDPISAPLNLYGREYNAGTGENYRLKVRFAADDREKIFGMGQYQQKQLDMKGCMLELAQRNSQITVPFYISNLGYGFLWNNPAVGKVTFAVNGTEWEAESSKEIDYLVIAGKTPAQIEETYMELTGRPPMMPEYGLGFWQCKLRYRSQDEVLSVAERYYKQGIPLDVIIVDFFHWTKEGEFCFDQKNWPDIPKMCEKLDRMGIKLMVSIWPTIDTSSKYYEIMRERGYLVQCDRGVAVTKLSAGNSSFVDATNQKAMEYIWNKIKNNYWKQGVRLFWLDVAEPQYTVYDFENYRYHLGTVLEIGNCYPKEYARGFYEGMRAEGENNPVSLIRSAWAGSAKYGSLVWSGDIVSSFECFGRQVRAGLSMAIAGIPWWTTDIGGFHGGNGDDPVFRELFIRWFEYGCFCPVMRLHGDREPKVLEADEVMGSGGPNEIWSFGEEVFEIAEKYIRIRESLRPYLREQMKKAHEDGTPVMRPYFYDYPDEEKAWEIDDAYVFGGDMIVAPVLESGMRERSVFLPGKEEWINFWTGDRYKGGNTIRVSAPIECIPVFVKKESEMVSRLITER